MPIPIRKALAPSKRSTSPAKNAGSVPADIPEQKESNSADVRGVEAATAATRRAGGTTQHVSTNAVKRTNTGVAAGEHRRLPVKSGTSSTSARSTQPGGNATRHARTISSSAANSTIQKTQSSGSVPDSGSASAAFASNSASSKSRQTKHPFTAETRNPPDSARNLPTEGSGTVRNELLQLQLLSRSAPEALAHFQKSVARKTNADAACVDEAAADVLRLSAQIRSARNARSLRDLTDRVEARGDTMESFWQRLSVAMEKIGDYVRELNNADGDGVETGVFGLVSSLVDHVRSRFDGDAATTNLSSPSRHKDSYERECPVNDHARNVLLNNQRDIALQMEILMAVPETDVDLGLATVVQRHIVAANSMLALYEVIWKIDQAIEADRKLRRSTEVDMAVEEARELRPERLRRPAIWNGPV